MDVLLGSGTGSSCLGHRDADDPGGTLVGAHAASGSAASSPVYPARSNPSTSAWAPLAAETTSGVPVGSAFTATASAS
jgi:hypothetical protein